MPTLSWGPAGINFECPSQEDVESDDEDDDKAKIFTVEIHRRPLPTKNVEAELALCNCLRVWNPWEEPTEELSAAIQSLSQLQTDVPIEQRCLLRSQVVQDLIYEDACLELLDDRLKYNGGSRYRLLQGKPALGSRNNERTKSVLDHIHTHVKLKNENIINDLNKDCTRSATNHMQGIDCLAVFRETPGAARNWRVLWHSLPPACRREALLHGASQSFEEHQKLPLTKRWCQTYNVMGFRVCQRAWCAITGIGHSSIQTSREAAIANKRSSLARSELCYHMGILGTKESPYLDVRAWLVVYADTHGENSPMHYTVL